MPVESAADRAAFFNPDEFGEPIEYLGEWGRPIETVALWLLPDDKANFDNGAQLDVHRFTVQRGAIAKIAEGGTVTVPRTGESFVVVRDSELSIDGAFEIIQAVPA